jgi:hypothetical protein
LLAEDSDRPRVARTSGLSLQGGGKLPR